MFIRSLARCLQSSSSSSSSSSISRQIISRSRFRPTRIITCYAVLATTTTSYAFSTTTTSLNNNNKINKMPGSPYQYGRGSNSDGSAKSSAVLDLSELGKTIMETATKRNDAFDKSRKIQMALLQVRNDIEESSTSTLSEDNTNSITESLLKIQDSIVEAMGKNNVDDKTHRVSRDANLNQRVEELCRLMAYHHFLKTGACILPPSGCNNVSKGMIVTDEEYLGGACMGLCQDLSRYAMGRACARDVDSVQQARDLVNQILDYLLQFDFRNGNLRRKYDGTKYALKSLETLLYELSVTGTSLEKVAVDTDANAGGERESKKPRLEEEANTTTTATASTTSTVEEELTALRQRMEHRDSLREKLIKKCRDGQKMAKQAIYALHRNDYKKSESLIKECENWIINELLPIVEEEPPLRYGSFAGVIEEYAEAKLFYVWLLGKPTITDDKNTMDIESDSSAKTTPGGAKGILLLPHEFEPIQLQPEDYLGGVCDLTGEIGRYAVQCGTARDYDGVSLCLESNSIILKSIQLLERSPSSINKKMQQLSKSVEKIQRMTYEMSLSKAAGMNINTEVKTTTESDVADNAE